MRPCTVHYVVSTEDAIVLGRHFYSTSTMMATISGIVHTFVTGNFAINDSHVRTRTMINRIFYMWLKFYAMDENERNNGELNQPFQKIFG
jgi:hypothetical protein